MSIDMLYKPARSGVPWMAAQYCIPPKNVFSLGESPLLFSTISNPMSLPWNTSSVSTSRKTTPEYTPLPSIASCNTMTLSTGSVGG